MSNMESMGQFDTSKKEGGELFTKTVARIASNVGDLISHREKQAESTIYAGTGSSDERSLQSIDDLAAGSPGPKTMTELKNQDPKKIREEAEERQYIKHWVETADDRQLALIAKFIEEERAKISKNGEPPRLAA